MHHARNTIKEWRLEGHTGKVTATGLGGQIMGKGAHLLIIDDFRKARKQRDRKQSETRCTAP